MADELYFDGEGLDGLARDLRSASHAVRRETDKTLIEIGAEITASAKGIASQHSKSIPATIKMDAIPGAVVIRAGSNTVPIAALYELGNKNSRRTNTTFRHPVYGDMTVWVEEEKHPFLRPAVVANRRNITKRMSSTWDHALRPYRLEPKMGEL